MKMQSLKVIYVIDSLAGGGTERSLAEMLPMLRQLGIVPIVICLYKRKGIEAEILSQKIDLRYLKGNTYIQQVYELRKIIQTEQPNLIHTALFASNLISRFAAYRLSVPVITSLVNTPYDPIRITESSITPWKLRIVQTIDSWTSRTLTTHFHAVSFAAKAAAIRDLGIPPERVTVVQRGRNPNRLGFPSTQRRIQVRQQLDLDEYCKVIINVGREDYQKGHRYLLQAVTILKNSYPNLVLLMAGERGNASDELDQICLQNNLSVNVRRLGFRHDVPDLLAAADLFVFPSLYEGMPGAVVEAMALGLPIVASKIAPVQEVVEEDKNALLVEPGSSTALCQKISCLLNNWEQASSMGKRSRISFEERFTIEHSVKEMVELYRQIS